MIKLSNQRIQLKFQRIYVSFTGWSYLVWSSLDFGVLSELIGSEKILRANHIKRIPRASYIKKNMKKVRRLVKMWYDNSMAMNESSVPYIATSRHYSMHYKLHGLWSLKSFFFEVKSRMSPNLLQLHKE